MAGSGSVTNDEVSADFTRAEIGRLPVPTDEAEEAFEEYIELIIEQIPALSAQSVTLEGGEMKYTGTAPTQLPRY